MRRKMFKTYQGLCLFLILGLFSQASVTTILETNFDGATPSAVTSDLDNVIWTTDAAITADTTIASVSGHELSNISENGTVSSEWDDNVGVHWNLNLSRTTPRGMVISFGVTDGVFQLSELRIGHTHTTNAGAFQAYDSDMTVTLTNLTDSTVLFTDTTYYSYGTSPRAWQSHTYDVSAVTLEAGKDYSMTLTMQDMVGGGAYATWNEVSLSGEAIDLTKAKLIAPDGADVLQDAILRWGPPTAYTPTGYDVYFGTNPDVYLNPKVISNSMVTSYGPPDLLDSATPYYWVVDVYGSTPSPIQGDRWSFITAPLPGDALKLTEWKLDAADTSGSDWMTADTSGQGNEGTFMNPPVSGPVFVAGVDGSCLELTGNDDSVVKENATFLPLNEDDPWTMNVYLYLNGKANDWTRIANVGDDNYRQLIIYRNNEIGFIYQNKYLLLSGTTLNPDRWYMVTVTFDNAYLRLFIDGVSAASKQLPFAAEEELDPELNMLNYAHAGHFSGRIDEFTFWDNALPLDKLAQLAGIVPNVGDTDNSGSIDLDDLKELAVNWLSDNSMMLADLILDDFQAYTGNTDPTFTAAWQAAVEGASVLSVSAGEMTWNYDLETGRGAGLYHWRDVGVDVSQYDQLHLKIYKNAGSTGEHLSCKFLDLDSDGTLWEMGQAACPGGMAAVPEGVWFDWIIDLNDLVTWDASAAEVPYDRMSDLDGLRIGIESETGGAGSLVIDAVKLVRTVPRCDGAGFMDGDLDGNCRIDMVDLSLFAANWLN